MLKILHERERERERVRVRECECESKKGTISKLIFFHHLIATGMSDESFQNECVCVCERERERERIVAPPEFV